MLVKRGVLLVLLCLPAVAVIIGHVLRLTTLPLATFLVFLAIVPFTAWISAESREPVSDLHRYAGYALVPLALSGLVLLAGYLFIGARYWEPWATLGTELTAEPVAGLSALAPGTVLVAVTALALVMGYYVLFRRYTVVNAAAYFGVPLIPVLIVHGSTMLLAFVTVVFGAVAAPYVPRRMLLVAAVVAVLPFAFAAERTLNRPPDIERAAFTEPRGDTMVLSTNGNEARYRFSMSGGFAGPVHVSGRLVHNGTVVAWCSGHLADGASADVPVTCAGPAIPADVDRVEVSWVVNPRQGQLTGRGVLALRRS